jgi:cob(I)alamin adenosyltransferase
MVILNRIYTRTGDDGTTALGSGERRPKYDLRVSAYGTVDETNAAIGVARLHLAQVPLIDAMLGAGAERSVRSRRRSGGSAA